MKVQVTKAGGFTNRVLAHSAREGLLLVDRDGVQEVPDHPAVHTLMASGTIKEVKGKAAAKPEEPEQEPEQEPEEPEQEPEEADDVEPETKPAPRRRNTRNTGS